MIRRKWLYTCKLACARIQIPIFRKLYSKERRMHYHSVILYRSRERIFLVVSIVDGCVTLYGLGECVFECRSFDFEMVRG